MNVNKMPQEAVTIKSCRICLDTKYSDCVSFDDGGKWLQLYKFCFGINLSSQDMPRVLCGICVKKMETFSKFKLLSQKSDKLWKTIVNINQMGSSENNVDQKPSLENIKEEYEDVYHVESSDAEADNILSDTCVNDLVKEENEPEIPECNDEEYSPDNETADDSEHSNDSDSEMYKCERCKMKYKFLKSYRNHLRRNNCKYREIALPKPKPRKKFERIQEFYCGLCKMQSVDPDVIKAHLNKHSKEDDLSCKLCEFIGRDFADMETHRYSHLPKNGPKIFVCHLCDKRSFALLALQFHYRTVHLKKEKGGVCTVCNKEYRVYKMWRNHERWHRAAKFICDICDKKFLFRNSIISHLKDHAEIRPYICDICGRGFKRHRNLTGHINTVHDNANVTCTHCDKVFKNQKCLELHMRLEAKQKQYQCDVCSKCFHTAHQMAQHMVWHSNDRPYGCDLCGATYKIKPQLKLHMRKHTGFKPYKCLLCPREFPTSKQLKVHTSVHSGMRRYKCPYCERSFHNKKNLVVHCDKAHHVTDFKISLPKKETEG